MLTYFFLLCAIFLEVTATMLLISSDQFTNVASTIGLLLCYSLSLYFLSLVVTKLPISVVYATWSGLGIAATSLLGYVIYSQALSWQVIAGFILIFLGIVLINYYAPEITLS